MTDQEGMSEEETAEESDVTQSATDTGEPAEDAPDEETAADESAQPDDGELDVAEELLDHVESSDSAEIADEIATLRFEVEALEAELDDYEEEVESLQSRLKRKQADFENYKKRMQKRREQEKARATEDLVTRLLDVRDNLQRALEQDEDTDIRDGIETTLGQFDRVLEDENVEPIEPDPGDEVDPERHEVLVRMDSDQPEGTIAEVHRPGYEMADKVIRTAQVAVSDE
ncbi:nucleotide exchange factor GrpE [Halapricum desulfuricans]|uniref:Protein GrpE n=1 Tax=Halapricum desulfuricans TaxID=2841257 RepID=A0A897NQG5_9EURY|nr:nucleotide exchange factor GrpE [Halapricum desulfuricans]QSG14684.1 Molecular chaperone GrpE (heat shock protein) [Halapricum desulfuricans]